MSDVWNIKYAEDIKKARELNNIYDPDFRGRFPWDRSERRGKMVNLSKASLGEFVYLVLSNGGDIKEFFVMCPEYHRSAVFTRVFLSMAAKEKIESETPYRFDAPPRVHVN